MRQGTRQLLLSFAEIDHILACLNHRDEGHDAGGYYGHKRLFEQRHRYLVGLFTTPDETEAKP
jgi:hypothetical protein